MDLLTVQSITSEFLIREPVRVEEIKTGNINSTFLITAVDGSRYILQRINKQVFEKPAEIMQNIRRVSRYLKRAVLREGGDPEIEVLHPIETIDNSCFVVDKQGEFWRMYDYIEGTSTYDNLDSTPIDSLKIFYEVGKAFGKFQERLIDFPAEILHAIPDFHNTPKRFADLRIAIVADNMCRMSSEKVKTAVDFILSHEEECRFIEIGKLSHKLPLRVTHNDTKLNNVMISNKTGEATCVIDLDTTGPDSILADYGDAIRSGANRAGEECTELDQVQMDFSLFEAYTKGYLENAKSITQYEKESLYRAPRILTTELAVRFMTDYLNGDTYFKLRASDPCDLNLTRALVQCKLSEDIACKELAMKKKIEEICKAIS